MHRIDHVTAAPGGLFTEGNPSGTVPATTVTADWLNALQEEIANVIDLAGDELDKEDNTQLAQAIAALIAASIPEVPAATEEAQGLVELATDAEVLAGTDAARAVTPATLLAGLLGAGGTGGNDYVTIPFRDKTSGVRRSLIIQWVTATVNASSSLAITLPVAFPTAGLFALGGDWGSAGQYVSINATPSTTQVTVNNGTAQTTVVGVIAIGH